MKKVMLIIAGMLLASGSAPANAGKKKADILVMSQNQYLGATLGPIISAGTPQEYATAIASVLQSIAANNFPERAGALAESISDRQPHLVALQEVFAFECTEAIPGACGFFQGAFNDHLELTLQSLDGLGADFYVAAEIRNLPIPTPFMESIGWPGLPVFLPGSDLPAMFISVIDRDVILARGDVTTNPAQLLCARPDADGTGCHYSNVATVNSFAGQISVERGHVTVDALVDGQEYRFVNTHLEVHVLAGNPASAALQAAQATELNFTLATNPLPDASTRLIVAGDINSAPTHEPILGITPPYQQFVNGLMFNGVPAFLPMTDTWTLRPGKPDGFTCCEAPDLMNAESELDGRIDVVLARPAPSGVKANVMDAEPDDKTASGLWPSDHASVIAELTY